MNHPTMNDSPMTMCTRSAFRTEAGSCSREISPFSNRKGLNVTPINWDTTARARIIDPHTAAIYALSYLLFSFVDYSRFGYVLWCAQGTRTSIVPAVNVMH